MGHEAVISEYPSSHPWWACSGCTQSDPLSSLTLIFLYTLTLQFGQLACYCMRHSYEEFLARMKLFREKGSLRYIAEKSRLHLALINGLWAYITGLSDAKAGKFPDIQSGEFLDRHIHDLHETPVIRCICASITYSGLPPRPILSSLASIDPNHSRWTEILDTLNSPDHEYSVNNYSFDPIKGISSDDQKRLKKSIKKTLRILAECLKAERARRNGINWVRGW